MFFRKRHRTTNLPARITYDGKITYSANGDAVCMLQFEGNSEEDVEVCLTHGSFSIEDPRIADLKYGQILSDSDKNPKVIVRGNKPSLDDTIETYLNSTVHSIIVTSPMTNLRDLAIEIKLTLWQRWPAVTAGSFGGTDILSINESGHFISQSCAVIDLSPDFGLEACEHSRDLFTSVNVPRGSCFNLTFIGFTPDTEAKIIRLQRIRDIIKLYNDLKK